MFTVGLTGGIGSGKSTVADRFAALGATLIDTDVLAREVVDPGSPALAAIVERFGPSVLEPGGTLDRDALRRQVFSDDEARLWLENLIHPAVGEEVELRLAADIPGYALLISPLLVETGRSQQCDRVLVVDLPEELQLARAAARDGGDEATIRRIMASQASRRERLAAADDVIDNSGPVEQLDPQVRRLHRAYLLAAGPTA